MNVLNIPGNADENSTAVTTTPVATYSTYLTCPTWETSDPNPSAALDRHDPVGLPPVLVSAGVVSAHHVQDLQTMLQRADSALYAAKRAGRDRTVSWAAEHDPRLSQPEERVAA